MNRIKAVVYMAAALLTSGAGAITDQEIEAKFSAMADHQTAPGEEFSEEKFADFLRDLVADVRLDDAGIDQLEALTPLFLYHPDTRQRMLVRLDRLRGEPGAVGARASVMAMVLRVRGASPVAMVPVVKEALSHPGLGESIRTGRASDLFIVLRGLPPEALEPNAEAIAALGDHFDRSMSLRALAISSDYPVVVGELAPVLGQERVARILAHFEELRGAMGGAAPNPASGDKETDMQDGGAVVNK